MRLALLRSVDLLVIESSLTGLETARRAALRGERVLVLERRTYLGYEIGEWLRLWRPGGEEPLADVWFPMAEPGAPLIADQWKLHAEDVLLGAGVELLYAVQPISLLRKENGYRVLIGSKCGIQAIDAKRVLDTSETQVTRFIGDGLTPGREWTLGRDGGTVVCTEWENLGGLPCEPFSLESISGAEKWNVQGNAVLVHPSAFSTDNRILKFHLARARSPWGARTPEDEAVREAENRRTALEICAALSGLPEFAGARYGTMSPQGMPVAEVELLDSLRLAERVEQAWAEGHDFLRVGYGITEPPVQSDSVNLDKSLRTLRSMEEDASYSEIDEPLPEFRQGGTYDVAVCGGGTSGAVCARAAAEQGAAVALVEMNPFLGGTGTAGGVHYYWYGRREGFTRRIDDEYQQLAERFHYPKRQYVWGERDDWNMDLKAALHDSTCRKAGVSLLFGSFACGVVMEGNRITGVALATPWGPVLWQAEIVVDATGDGDVALMAGASAIYGSVRDRMTMWSCMAQYKQAGMYRGGIFTTSANVGDLFDYTRYLLVNRRRGSENAYDHGIYLAPRETRHVKGDVTITVKDVVLGRRYEDTVNVCFSNFDTKGKSYADLVYFGYLPPQMETEIPYRAALPAGIEGLLVTGKAFSATHDALSGLRMQDDLQNHGGAMGIAAAMAAKAGGTREISIHELQRLLRENGTLAAKDRRLPPALPKRPDYAELVHSLTGFEEFETIDMDMGIAINEVSPIVLLCLAERERVLPLLREEYACSKGERRLLFARLLLWHWDDTGLGIILERLSRELNETDGPPQRAHSVKFCQPYPDHGVMAEFTYLANELYKSDDIRVPALFERLMERLEQSHRDYRDQRDCIFSHMESAAYVAERRGDPAFLPALLRLLAFPEFRGIERLRNQAEPSRLNVAEHFDVDSTEERILYVKLLTARAAARCGAREGYEILLLLSGDCRSLVAGSALDELRALTGKYTREELACAVAGLPGRVQPQPWREEIW